MYFELLRYRKKLNIEQDEMANYLGMKQPNYSKKEKGTVKFYLDEAVAIQELFKSRGLDLSLEEIFKKDN